MESLKDIRKILDRFYAGETTLEEERILQDYFSKANVPEELLPERDLFRSLEPAGNHAAVPESLNRKILGVIDQLEKNEVRTRRISVYALSGLAAGLLIAVALYTGYFKSGQSNRIASQELTDTYDNPADAYEEAKKTLAYVSSKLNTGTSELEYVKQVTKTTSDPLKSLSKINKGSKELSLLGQLQRVGEFQR